MAEAIATPMRNGWETMADTDTEELPANSPSTPPASPSTRGPATVDGQAPVDGPPSARPVEAPAGARSLDAIKADLAAYVDAFNNTEWPREQWLTEVGEAAVGVCESVPQLLAEVEAAHRFERSVAVEREALLGELDAVKRDRARLIAEMHGAHRERDSLRGVVQAVERLTTEAECRTGYLPAPGVVVRVKAVSTSLLRNALAAAADAPQPDQGMQR